MAVAAARISTTTGNTNEIAALPVHAVQLPSVAFTYPSAHNSQKGPHCRSLSDLSCARQYPVCNGSDSRVTPGIALQSVDAYGQSTHSVPLMAASRSYCPPLHTQPSMLVVLALCVMVPMGHSMQREARGSSLYAPTTHGVVDTLGRTRHHVETHVVVRPCAAGDRPCRTQWAITTFRTTGTVLRASITHQPFWARAAALRRRLRGLFGRVGPEQARGTFERERLFVGVLRQLPDRAPHELWRFACPAARI
eukprot:7300806-Prymnesium_polylepis.1